MKAEESEIRRKRRVLEHAVESGNVAKTCRYFGVPRTSFYRWRNAYQEHGEEGRTAIDWACATPNGFVRLSAVMDGNWPRSV